MDYFLTSFFRIRVVVVLAFLALCFFVGSIENAFASRYEAVARIGNHSGSYVRDNLSTKQAHGRPQSISRAGDSFSELGWSPIVLRWTDTDIYSGGPITIVYCDHFDNDLASFATGARYVWQEALDDYLSLPIKQPTDDYQSLCIGDPCDQERLQLIHQCGGNNNVDWATWNDSTCTGECKLSINANLGSPKPDQCPIP